MLPRSQRRRIPRPALERIRLGIRPMTKAQAAENRLAFQRLRDELERRKRDEPDDIPF